MVERTKDHAQSKDSTTARVFMIVKAPGVAKEYTEVKLFAARGKLIAKFSKWEGSRPPVMAPPRWTENVGA